MPTLDMLEPAPLDVTVRRHATWRRVFTLYTDDAGTTPWDLTAHTAQLTVWDTHGTQADQFAATTGGTAGTIDAKRTVTQLIPWPQRGSWELAITNGTDTAVILAGTLAVV